MNYRARGQQDQEFKYTDIQTKNYYKMRKSNFYLSLLLSTFIISISYGQGWKTEYSPSKAFIENKGQFKSNNEKQIGGIDFAVDYGSTKIFFGKKGVSFDFMEAQKKSRAEREEIMAQQTSSIAEHKQKERLVGKFLYKFDDLHFLWENTSSEYQLIGLNEFPDYHSYSYNNDRGETISVGKVKGFEKIRYTNIYPGVDIEYTIHPESGVKYALYLQPNADPSHIAMSYDREIKIESGTIHIPTSFGDILDHAPLTFYDQNKDKIIPSEFRLNKNTVSFKLGEYDQQQAIVIDPWVQTPTFNTDWDCIWEVEYDAAGNVYAIGGTMPMVLQKYNSTGVLQWTHNTPYDTTSWLGGFSTDDNGISYVTQGSTASIQKVDAAGNVEWTNNGGGTLGNSDEYWNVQFNCDESKIIVGGTAGAFGLPPALRAAVFEIDVNNGNVLNTRDLAVGNTLAIPPTIQEVRSLSASPSSKYYWLAHDTIGYINDNLDFCDEVVKFDNQINFAYKNENYRYSNTGIMSLKADDNFIYLHRGDEIQKRDPQTLAIVASAPIPNGAFNGGFGGNTVENSGIDVDDCGNIYVGSTNQVIQYDNNLNILNTYSTSFRVYDVHVAPNGRIIAGGSTGTSNSNSRDGYIQQWDVGSCAPLALTCCDANFCPEGPFCVDDAPVTITVSQPGGTFSGPGVDPSTGEFDPSVAGAGTHDITYTLPCGEETRTIIVNPCSALTVCEDENGDLVVSGGNGPYDWQEEVSTNTPITNQTECEACGGSWLGFGPLGQCNDSGFPPTEITSCNSTDWVTYATGTTVAPPATFPLQVVDSDGSSVIINSASEIDLCDDDPVDPGCPTITVSIDAQTDITCFGAADGTATVSAAGGNPTYTYTWMPGNLTGASQSNLAPGVYTVTATDQDDCTGEVEVTIDEPDAIVLSSTSTPPTCGVEDGEITVSVDAGGTGSFTYDWQPGGAQTATVSNLGAGSYTVTVTDGNGCSEELIVNLSSTDAPEITIEETNPASCANTADGSATVSVTGGNPAYTYSWSPSGGTGLTATGLTPGNYSFTVTDSDNCSASVTVTIDGPTPITINGNTTGTSCAGGDGAINVTASGGNGGYTYAWTPNVGTTASVSNLNNGQYTVTVTDNQGCSNSETFVVSQADTVIVEAVPNSVIITNGDNVTLSANTIPPSPTNTYSWSPDTGLSCTDCPNPVASPTETTTYTVTVTTDEGCVGEADVLITVEEPCGEPYLPTIFSPNGDGTNDFLCVLSNCVLSLEMSIYNRWGEQVFTTGSTEDCWDGTYKGKDVNSGVFVYKLRIRLTNGEERLESGNITLVR